MKYINATSERAFTLIEVLIVIFILGIMLTATYAPYSHYQKKALLKQWKKEIIQSIYEARNLAINGLADDTTDSNVSVWLYIDTRDASNKIMQYYSYDNLNPDFLPSAFPATWTVNLLKQKDLPNHIQFDSVASWSGALLFFQAITWSGSYYVDNGSFTRVIDSEIDVNISYKWATTPTLQWSIDYYTNTYIADY